MRVEDDFPAEPRIRPADQQSRWLPTVMGVAAIASLFGVEAGEKGLIAGDEMGLAAGAQASSNEL